MTGAPSDPEPAESGARDGAVVWCSDGPRLVLADGSVVKLRVSQDGLVTYRRRSGATAFYERGGEVVGSVALVRDEHAAGVEAVRDALDDYGFR